MNLGVFTNAVNQQLKKFPHGGLEHEFHLDFLLVMNECSRTQKQDL